MLTPPVNVAHGAAAFAAQTIPGLIADTVPNGRLVEVAVIFRVIGVDGSDGVGVLACDGADPHATSHLLMDAGKTGVMMHLRGQYRG